MIAKSLFSVALPRAGIVILSENNLTHFLSPSIMRGLVGPGCSEVLLNHRIEALGGHGTARVDDIYKPLPHLLLGRGGRLLPRKHTVASRVLPLLPDFAIIIEDAHVHIMMAVTEEVCDEAGVQRLSNTTGADRPPSTIDVPASES